MTYAELGGAGIPRVYIGVISNDCPSCSAKRDELCVDPDGSVRKRPHIRRALTGGSSDTQTAM